jgi:hypothetical protein
MSAGAKTTIFGPILSSCLQKFILISIFFLDLDFYAVAGQLSFSFELGPMLRFKKIIISPKNSAKKWCFILKIQLVLQKKLS